MNRNFIEPIRKKHSMQMAEDEENFSSIANKLKINDD